MHKSLHYSIVCERFGYLNALSTLELKRRKSKLNLGKIVFTLTPDRTCDVKIERGYKITPIHTLRYVRAHKI